MGNWCVSRVVMLWLKGESGFTGEFGPNTFVYRYAPPGEYDVWIDDELGSQKSRVVLGEGSRVFWSSLIKTSLSAAKPSPRPMAGS